MDACDLLIFPSSRNGLNLQSNLGHQGRNIVRGKYFYRRALLYCALIRFSAGALYFVSQIEPIQTGINLGLQAISSCSRDSLGMLHAKEINEELVLQNGISLVSLYGSLYIVYISSTWLF
jgi:hypothetical protein